MRCIFALGLGLLTMCTASAAGQAEGLGRRAQELAKEKEKGQPDKKEIKEAAPAPKVNRVLQGFPAAKASPGEVGPSDTAWDIEWDITSPDNGAGKKNASPSSVLAIRSAKFMFKDSQGKPRWFTVLKNLEVGEILVPYDRLEPVFMDVAEHAFRIIPAKKEYLGPACVTPGEILDSHDPRMKDKVHKEVHDDGLRWLNGANKARRGEKMLLWSVFDGANYRYILEYGFGDDGVITCRIGATAHNFFAKQKDQRDVHLHVGCWRFDPELSEAGSLANGGPAQGGTTNGSAVTSGPNIGGANQNQVLLVRRLPRNPVPNGMFKVDVSPFNPSDEGKAMEGYADWKAEEFTVLRVQSSVRKNSSKDPQFTAYDLVPIRAGAVRHYPWKYDFANHDFWVTQKRPTNVKYHEVPLYAGRSRALDKGGVTVWHNTPSWHIPRGEDYGPDGASAYKGSAITNWAGFMLKPINLFDSTPLYPVAVSK